MNYNYEFVGTEHVSGMCQMFRRECFEEIKGYAAIKSGGIDLIAVLSARAKGWETRTFLEKTFEHHRQPRRCASRRPSREGPCGQKRLPFGKPSAVGVFSKYLSNAA